MVCLNLHQLLNTEFIISYLSSNKAGIIDRENEYTCFKSMRPFSRFFYIIEGETFFTFTCNDGTQKTIREEKNDIVFLPDDIEYKSFDKNKNSEKIHYKMIYRTPGKAKK